MKRNLEFESRNGLSQALKVDSKKIKQIEAMVTKLIREKKMMCQIINFVNDNYDLTDSEFASFMYGLGHLNAKLGY